MNSKIQLHHGDGGKYTSILIKELFHNYFNNELLLKGLDSAVFKMNGGKIAYTTDSFVIKPLFFSGGDIGKLAIYGTVNDLLVSGAVPHYLSAGFIIEEGLEYNILERIVKSMAEACQEASVKIVTGDTKVVEKGSVDGIYINTSGIGVVGNDYLWNPIIPGDKIIISGSIAEHGTTIAIERYGIRVKGNFKSDCASLNKVISQLSRYRQHIKLMKDPTRGGVATVLNEIAEIAKLNIKVMEDHIPIRKEVKYINEMLGLDPLYLPSEGRLILVVDGDAADEVLRQIKALEECRDADIIGCFEEGTSNIVYLQTYIGGKRILNVLDGPMLPRIC